MVVAKAFDRDRFTAGVTQVDMSDRPGFEDPDPRQRQIKRQ